MFSKTILEPNELVTRRKTGEGNSLKGRTIYSCSKESSEPSLFAMHDRHLAPSYPGFSIDSYKGEKKPSFVNQQMEEKKEGKVMNSKKLGDSDYEI